MTGPLDALTFTHPTGWLGLVVVAVMVGFLVDGRVRGPGDRALAEDAARGMASDGVQTHLFELVPTPARAPRALHSVRSSHGWLRHEPQAASNPEPAAWLDAEPSDACLVALADQVAASVERESIGTLHAIGLGLPGVVAKLVQAKIGTPYCLTPRTSDLVAVESLRTPRALEVLRGAQHVVLFDESHRPAMEAAFPVRAGESPLRWRILRRGVDLELFKPVPRQERGSAAAMLAARPEIGSRLAGVDWARACVVLCLQHGGEPEGFAQFLFALPELVRQQPMLQAVVVSIGDLPAAVDRLRAALATARPEALHGVLQESELYQPLLDHLEHLHREGRAEEWWRQAARVEPERRVRYVGEVTREEFARLVSVADLVVVPGIRPRPASHVPVEALAAGVPAVASAHAGMQGLARLVADGISAEIASLCVLRDDAPPVQELEDKLGRFVRLRPELGERLRALAVRKFDGRQTAADLRRLYGETARTAARA